MTNEEILYEALRKHNSSTGGPTRECHCGRYHFACNSENFDENELEELMKKMETDPKHYVCDNENDSISSVYFNGSEFVYGCPCKWEERYAAFLWAEHDTIAEFLRMKKTEIFKETIRVDESLSGI